MVLLDGDVLCEFDIVDGLQYRQSLADSCNADFLEALGFKKTENIAGDVVFCESVCTPLVSTRRAETHL